MRDQTSEVLDATLKTAPPAVVTFYATILDRPIEFWVAAITIIYMALQVYLLIRDRVMGRRRRRRATDKEKQ